MADYGKYLAPRDLEAAWLQDVIQEREKELRYLKATLKRLKREWEAETRSY